MFNIKPMTEGERIILNLQDENLKKIADAVTGNDEITVNMNTIGPYYHIKGLSKVKSLERTKGLAMALIRKHGVKLKVVSLDGEFCIFKNMTDKPKEDWSPVEVEFTVK